ncbi:MAG: undecaprenyl-diphosphatase [Spirochaetes bacterium]|nr:undecaprenyl-diphosphatase [Spirochaetota bacterium]
MSVLEAILLGVVQGLTEFLPVSSSGHLAVLKHLFGQSDVPVLFDVLLHVSTLGVVVLVFRDRIGAIIASLVRWVARRSDAESDAKNLRIVVLALLATVVTGVLGLAISRLEAGRYPKLVGVLFLVTAAILVTTRFARGTRGYAEMGAGRALLVGFAQGLGVFPGISRAGITISAGLLSGVARREAAEFSFLISIPAILAALGVTLRDATELAATVPLASLISGLVSSFVVGLLSLRLLLRLVRGGRLYLFALYLVPLGILTILLT